MSMPRNSMPRPMAICPPSLTAGRLPASCSTAPIAVKMTAKLTSTDSISEVTVVPMFAPIITPMAWLNCKRPAFTKPTTMTVVALLD